MAESEIASFRQEQALQEQAAYSGLHGPAAVARHDIITARMDRGAERLLQLIQEGKQQEAFHLMETTSWAIEEIHDAYHTTIPATTCILLVEQCER